MNPNEVTYAYYYQYVSSNMTMTQLIRANELVREGPFLAPKTNSNDRLNDIILRVQRVCKAFGGRFLGHWCLNFSNWTWFVQCTPPLLILRLDRTGTAARLISTQFSPRFFCAFAKMPPFQFMILISPELSSFFLAKK